MIDRPLALDLCCGLGGWAAGLIAAGFDVVGVDIEERFRATYPGWFLQSDVISLSAEWHLSIYDTLRIFKIDTNGRRFSLVVASPPCQQYSRHDQPWTRKRNPPPPDHSVWNACVRIAASIGAPLIIENVRGAQAFHGWATWHYGPYYLWGDVPALMVKFMADRERKKESRSSTAIAERSMVPFELAYHVGKVFASHAS